MAKAVDIIDRDPKGKWEGGKKDNDLPDSAVSAQLKTVLFKETRVLNEKMRKLTKMLDERNLSTAERYALRKSLSDTQASIKKMADASQQELKFLASSEKYQQDSMRKLSDLRKWYAAELKKPQPETKEQKAARDEMLKGIRSAANHLSELTKKDPSTSAGRLGTLKALSRVDKLMQGFPDDLKELFEAQTEKTEELIGMQRKIFDEEESKAKKRRDDMADQIKDWDKRREDAIKEIDAAGAADARRRFIAEKGERAWQAKQELDAGAKRRREGLKNRGMNILDRIGFGKANLGNVARGIGAANNLRKDFRDGKTGIQRYAQNKAALKGQDGSSLRFGLGRTEKEDTSKEDFMRAFEQSQAPKAQARVAPVADPNQSQWARYAKNGSFDEKDQDENDLGRIADALEKHGGETTRFNSRLLQDTHKIAYADRKAANDSKGGSSGGFMGGGGILRSLGTTILPMLAAAGPALLAALGPGLLLMLGKSRKEEIEKDPTNKKFDDNSYARVLRGKADNIGQAAAMQQQKALKTLQPGTAKQYLEAGPDKDGKYLDGYSKTQLEDMAAGKKPDTGSMEKFVTIQTGAQKAASDQQAAKDDNGDVGRMAARSQVSIPGAGSADAAPVGAMGVPMSGKGGKMPGAAGSGGLIKDGMGKFFTKSGNVDTDGVNPQMQSKLTAMGQEYFEATGKKINFNSAYRSIADQEKLYKSMPKGMAAKPGSSLHNFGLAVDIPSATANELDKLGLLGKYGFERPIANEKWHVQPKGMSAAAARSGLYSADAPANQGAGGGGAAAATAAPTTPTVADASQVDPPRSSSASQPSGGGGSGGNSGASSGSTPISVASIPTFDSSDGMFLSLNMGVV